MRPWSIAAGPGMALCHPRRDPRRGEKVGVRHVRGRRAAVQRGVASGRGRKGRVLVELIKWAETTKDTTITDRGVQEVKTGTKISGDAIKMLNHELCIFLKNFAERHAKEVIQHGVKNGVQRTA